MRAGPLSSSKVIDLLNGYFVPVYTSNDEVPGEPGAARKEEAERQRLFLEFDRARLGTGSVQVWILTWDARPLTRLHVAQAAEKDTTLDLLRKIIDEEKPAKGAPVVKPRPQSAPPTVRRDEAVLQIVARKLEPRHSWNEFPAEDWLVLSPEAWKNLLPADDVGPGRSRDVAPDLTAAILTRFFPQTECCTAKDSKLLAEDGPYKHRLENGELRARVVSVKDGEGLARIEGRSRVLHQFYPDSRHPPAVSRAEVLGYVRWSLREKKLLDLRLVTNQGRFDQMGMGVAVKLVTRPGS